MTAPAARPVLPASFTSRTAALAVLAGAAAVIAAFLVFEHAFGYLPCPLCLQQRAPWYFAALLAALLAVTPRAQTRLRRVGLLLLTLVFLVSAGLGAYHAGVEWGLWPGPADCSGGGAMPASASELLGQLERVRPVSCTEAAWRFLGLSMAGWNVAVSLLLAAVAALGAMADAPGRSGAPGSADTDPASAAPASAKSAGHSGNRP